MKRYEKPTLIINVLNIKTVFCSVSNSRGSVEDDDETDIQLGKRQNSFWDE